jgi:hypothetical protein
MSTNRTIQFLISQVEEFAGEGMTIDEALKKYAEERIDAHPLLDEDMPKEGEVIRISEHITLSWRNTYTGIEPYDTRAGWEFFDVVLDSGRWNEAHWIDQEHVSFPFRWNDTLFMVTQGNLVSANLPPCCKCGGKEIVFYALGFGLDKEEETSLDGYETLGMKAVCPICKNQSQIYMTDNDNQLIPEDGLARNTHKVLARVIVNWWSKRFNPEENYNSKKPKENEIEKYV